MGATTAAQLTSRQRMTRMLERRDHDRIPRHDGYWPETIARWNGEGFEGDGEAALRRLGSDVEGIVFAWPRPFPGSEQVLEEDAQTKVVRDDMGQVKRVWKDRWGTPEHIAFGCDGADKWFTVYKPALLAAAPSIVPGMSQWVPRWKAMDRAEKFCTLNGVESFEAMRQLVGDEVLLMAMAQEQEWVADMSATYTDLLIKEWQVALDTGMRADAIWVFGDVGYNHGPFFSPDMYRQLIQRDHQRLVRLAHQNGLKFIYHTDGDVRPLVDAFVENGYDCLQPMEAKANMDVRLLAPRYGDRLSFFGNIDMTVACRNDREALEHEVRSKLAAGMANRGYAYHSDHSVPPGVSWRTYQWLIELLDRHGNYA
ncbi:MAG: uroporphyrinogen decarboxylase family protein [Phycisphaerales bacterium]